MELKRYQKQVIRDLSRYLGILNKTRDMSAAFRDYWAEKGVTVGPMPVPEYQNIVPGVPSLCAKVPTGGGKTLLACNAIRPVFDALPPAKIKAVVWLVPSDAILTQTLAALQDPFHPYRQKIDADFGGRVEVYSKQQLLDGQNFNITSVTEQLSVMLLSYDSFRGQKENLKARQENSSLAGFAKALGAPENPVPDADETGLIQVINQLSPLVIVDESHHAKSKLSLEMLRDFNPCFILELTATPRKESNIFAFVDAAQLKRENMVKLPVVVFNRDSQSRVLTDAVDFRRSLEELAKEDRKQTGRYIRPIALFQAQSKGGENRATYEKLREKLTKIGIPQSHIAIRTADINELRRVNLMSEDCPIRYIITVDALKEGWDCPFAYILASLANKTSQVDVEQIVGRILRLPDTQPNPTRALNQSYVLTSSDDFHRTLNNIISALNGAGFTEKDYRLAEPNNAQPENTSPENQGEQVSIPANRPETGQAQTPATASVSDSDEDFMNFDADKVSAELAYRRNSPNEAGNSAERMLAESDKAGQDYEQKINAQTDDSSLNGRPAEGDMPTFYVYPEFEEEIRALRLPQFFYRIQGSLYPAFLEKDFLTEDFSLKGKPADIDFIGAERNMVEIDVRDSRGNTPRVYKLEAAEQRYIKEKISHLPQKERVRRCKGYICHELNKLNFIDEESLTQYVDAVVETMSEDQLAGLEKSYSDYAEQIKKKIYALRAEYAMRRFDDLFEIGEIFCQENWTFPNAIHPKKYTSAYGNTLYTAEGKMDGLERDFAMELTSAPSVHWWHRNTEDKEGFRLNGFINHYPDFIIMTKKGTLILAETKGPHLDNHETQLRVKLGRAWEKAAGSKYRYYMVFPDKNQPFDGVCGMSRFLELLKNL